MKMTAIDTRTNKPLANTTLQLQTRDKSNQTKNASIKTDQTGAFNLSGDVTQVGYNGKWVTASEGSTLSISGGATGGAQQGQGGQGGYQGGQGGQGKPQK